jgi:hypothetical protein
VLRVAEEKVDSRRGRGAAPRELFLLCLPPRRPEEPLCWAVGLRSPATLARRAVDAREGLEGVAIVLLKLARDGGCLSPAGDADDKLCFFLVGLGDRDNGVFCELMRTQLSLRAPGCDELIFCFFEALLAGEGEPLLRCDEDI